MAKYLIVGVAGEDNLWLVDCEAMTVEKIEADSLGAGGAADGDLIANTSEARGQGFTVVKGIDLAVSAESRSGVSAHVRYVES